MNIENSRDCKIYFILRFFLYFKIGSNSLTGIIPHITYVHPVTSFLFQLFYNVLMYVCMHNEILFNVEFFSLRDFQPLIRAAYILPVLKLNSQALKSKSKVRGKG